MIKIQELRALLSMTKPRIVMMALITLSFGFWAGSAGDLRVGPLLMALLGAGLVAAGASVLNHYMEREADGLMKRTMNRPLPAGLIRPVQALIFGIYLILAGLGVLLLTINVLTAFLLLLSAFLYVLVYTPMKRVSWLNTSLGAIPGAIPPLAGWTAATGTLGLHGWLLFLILFVWQHPHFFAIAWMYREDYRNAGFRMLSTDDGNGSRTALGVILTSLVLIPISLLPVSSGLAHQPYFWCAAALGAMLLAAGARLAKDRSRQNARSVLKASVYYLPALLGSMVLDHCL